MPDSALQSKVASSPVAPPEPTLRRRVVPMESDPVAEELAARNRDFFDGYWGRGQHERDRLWRAWWRDGYDQILAWAGPLAGKRVLNLFAGLGEDAAMLARHGAEVIALDFSLPGLHHAARARSLPANPHVVCADARHLPVASHSVDLVVAVNGLCHTDKLLVLAECRRVLLPGGKVLFLEVMRYPHLAMLARFLEPYRWRAPHRFVSVGEMASLARGFAQVQHRQFFLLSVVSAMLLRLPLGPTLFLPLHRLLIAADRHVLRWLPFLRRFSYLCAAELRV